VFQSVAVCCSVLQCTTVCYSRLQCVAVCCSVLQCVAVCCSVLQCVAVCCSVLQCIAVCRYASTQKHSRALMLQCVVAVHCCSALPCAPHILRTTVMRCAVQANDNTRWASVLQCVAVCRSVLQCGAVCCSVAQCVELCKSVLQGVAVYCMVLQCAACTPNLLPTTITRVRGGSQ